MTMCLSCELYDRALPCVRVCVVCSVRCVRAVTPDLAVAGGETAIWHPPSPSTLKHLLKKEGGAAE